VEIVVILLGLHTTGIIQIPFLYGGYTLSKTNTKRDGGNLSAFLMGIIFSAGWSPCVGPVIRSYINFIFARKINILELLC
jgi:cytochrome c-type biogenesis protein